MADITSTRPLPVDYATLKAYLPAEPSDTAVTRWRAALAVIDAATTEARRRLADADEAERAAAVELSRAAHDGDDLTPTLAGWQSERPAVEAQIALLARARANAFAELGRAERTDPVHAAWRSACEQITHEWQCVGGSTPEEHFAGLVVFAAAH